MRVSISLTSLVATMSLAMGAPTFGLAGSGDQGTRLGRPVTILANGVRFTPFTAEDKTLEQLIENQDQTGKNNGAGNAYLSMDRRLFCNNRGLDLRTGRPTVCPGPLFELSPHTTVYAVLDGAGEPVKPDGMMTVLVRVGTTYGGMRWSDYENAESAPRRAEEARLEVAESTAAAERTRESEEAAGAAAERNQLRAIQAENAWVAKALLRRSAVCPDEADQTPRAQCDLVTILTTYDKNQARFQRDYVGRKISIVGIIRQLSTGYITIVVGANEVTCWPSGFSRWPEIDPHIADWNRGDRIVVTGDIWSSDNMGRRASSLWVNGCVPRKLH